MRYLEKSLWMLSRLNLGLFDEMKWEQQNSTSISNIINDVHAGTAFTTGLIKMAFCFLRTEFIWKVLYWLSVF